MHARLQREAARSGGQQRHQRREAFRRLCHLCHGVRALGISVPLCRREVEARPAAQRGGRRAPAPLLASLPLPPLVTHCGAAVGAHRQVVDAGAPCHDALDNGHDHTFPALSPGRAVGGKVGRPNLRPRYNGCHHGSYRDVHLNELVVGVAPVLWLCVWLSADSKPEGLCHVQPISRHHPLQQLRHKLLVL